MSKIQFDDNYQDIISVENLLSAWQEFVRGKRNRLDVQRFELRLMENIIDLHDDLADKTYRHSDYHAFNISDPKPRNIHKACVRDRLLHRALYRKLYPFFDQTFITDSYSCRLNKGTHKALDKFNVHAQRISKNHTQTVWALKCDIKKFFASVDHDILMKIIKDYIPDPDIQWLISQVLNSFYSNEKGKGLPLGNLTSQLFANVYMNKLDQYMKHALKTKYYIRYADDFVILSTNRPRLINLFSLIDAFLAEELHLQLHASKIFIKTIASGVDFLGWVHFTDHRVLRTVSRRRMLSKLNESHNNESIQSYLGMLKHGNAKNLEEQISSMNI